MIIVEKSKKNISIKGHALYSDFGRDIVCSAVSSIVITSINGILGIDKDSVKVDELMNLVYLFSVCKDVFV